MVKVTKAMIQILRRRQNDVINLIDHLKLENIRLIGYSMGTVIALDLLSTHPEYFSKAVLIATGDGLIGLPLYI
jgi:pimeloyl-ACP methyl ester carboxylesterase